MNTKNDSHNTDFIKYLDEKKVYNRFKKEKIMLMTEETLLNLLKDLFPSFQESLFNFIPYQIITISQSKTGILLQELWQYFLNKGMKQSEDMKMILNDYFYIKNNLGQLCFSYEDTQLFPKKIDDMTFIANLNHYNPTAVKTVEFFNRFTFVYRLIVTKNKNSPSKLIFEELDKIQSISNQIFDKFAKANILTKDQVECIIIQIDHISKSFCN